MKKPPRKRKLNGTALVRFDAAESFRYRTRTAPRAKRAAGVRCRLPLKNHTALFFGSRHNKPSHPPAGFRLFLQA